MGDTSMNKKAYEAPEMITRMIATQNVATDLSSGGDNEFSGGTIDWS